MDVSLLDVHDTVYKNNKNENILRNNISKL